MIRREQWDGRPAAGARCPWRIHHGHAQASRGAVTHALASHPIYKWRPVRLARRGVGGTGSSIWPPVVAAGQRPGAARPGARVAALSRRAALGGAPSAAATRAQRPTHPTDRRLPRCDKRRLLVFLLARRHCGAPEGQFVCSRRGSRPKLADGWPGWKVTGERDTKRRQLECRCLCCCCCCCCARRSLS